MSGGVDYPIVPAFVFIGSGADGIYAGGCDDVSCALIGGVTGGASVVRPDAMSMSGTEPVRGPLVFDGGFQFGDVLLECLLPGGRKVVASAAATVVVAPDG